MFAGSDGRAVHVYVNICMYGALCHCLSNRRNNGLYVYVSIYMCQPCYNCWFGWTGIISIYIYVYIYIYK